MKENKAFVPLYLNDDVVNNLFTIVVQEFVESKTLNQKDQITVNCRLPLSEFSYELFGKYVQGDVNVQIVNEFSKQKTRAEVSKNIEIFINLRDLLLENKLLRYIEEDEPVSSIHENDFIIVNCKLRQNPAFNYLQNMISKIEMQNAFKETEKKSSRDEEAIRSLNKHMEEWRKNRCIRHYTNELCNPRTRFIVPIEYRHGIVNTDYITNGKVNVMGKVINCIDTSNQDFTQFIGDAFLDFINENYFLNFANGFANIGSAVNTMTNRFTSNEKLIEILPIAIFL